MRVTDCDKHSWPSVAYGRSELLTWYSAAQSTTDVAERVRSLGLRSVCRLRRMRRHSNNEATYRLERYRGRRSGRSKRPPPSLRPVGNGAYVIVGCRSVERRDPRRDRPRPSLLSVHVDRHSATSNVNVVFGCLNIRSVVSKMVELLDVRRDQSIDVMFLVETWHDDDSVTLRRLRVDGYQVIDRPRPRVRSDTISTNHGGMAAVAVPGIRLTLIDLGVKPETFELLCVRVVQGSSACVVAVVYRPGSEPMTSLFFSDISDVLDRLVTFADPVYLVGDVNIRLERSTNPATGQFADLLAAYGLVNRVATATHDRGGALDIVAMRDDLPSSPVDVVDVGLSDHRLLRWSVSLARPCPVYTTTTFRDAVSSSSLSRPEMWTSLDADDLARLYDSEITAILDRLVPVRTVRCQRRASDPWFDDDCRAGFSSVERVVLSHPTPP